MIHRNILEIYQLILKSKSDTSPALIDLTKDRYHSNTTPNLLIIIEKGMTHHGSEKENVEFMKFPVKFG